MKLLWLPHLIPCPLKEVALQRIYNMLSGVSKYREIKLLSFKKIDFLAARFPHHNDPLEFVEQELLKSIESLNVMAIPKDAISGGRYLTVLKALVRGRAYNMEWLRSAVAREIMMISFFTVPTFG